MYYFDFFYSLDKNEIDYLVVGGLAVNLHGGPRLTHDIDILLSFDRENIARFNRMMKEMGYLPRLPVNPNDLADEKARFLWTSEKNMRAFSYYHMDKSYRVIDVVIYEKDYNELKKKRVIKEAAGIKIYLISIEDLVEMKTAAGRKQDLSDVVLLNKIANIMEEDGQ